MTLAILNGLLTSILLETVILSRQMALSLAFRTAVGMSLISMIAMELAMNLTDVALTGGARDFFEHGYYSTITSASPYSIGWAFCTKIFTTVPAFGAVIGFITFIASTMNRV